MSRLEAAIKIRQQMQRTAAQHRNVMRGTVVKLTPLTIDLPNGKRLEVDDDFDLASWARFYDHAYGIRVNDTAILHYEDGQYVVLDILGDIEHTTLASPRQP